MSATSKETTPKDITSFFGQGKTENYDDSVGSPPDGPPAGPPREKLDEEGRFLCGDIDIRIDREGLWFYHGTPIGRKELVKLFSTVIHKDGDGKYWLITPAEKGGIVVEDAPFMAVELTVHGSGNSQSLKFRTNVDEIVIADSAHPLRFEEDSETKEPSPYILVRDNLEAKLTRSVFYQLVELGEEQETPNGLKYGVWSNGTFFEIGQLEESVENGAP